MKIFLAATHSCIPGYRYLLRDAKYVLESFFTVRQWQLGFIKKWDSFLLDSGAFSFMADPSKKVDFDSYMEKYIDFINMHDISHFFELDIDSVVGIKKVEKMRQKLENKTGKRCIPVFHRSRGKQYWLDMVKEYDYVAIGGFAIRNIKPSEYKYIEWFLKTAQEANCKVHGLGFTSQKYLDKLPFYSVDSSSWTSGLRYGSVYQFINGKMTATARKPNQAMVAKRRIYEQNLTAWIKMQNYYDREMIK